jgi:transcriptional regulator with XRE-family HTH domain
MAVALPTSFGLWLKHWRSQRNFSQLDLAVVSEVSQRHISFLESGRSQPSREMVLRLATVLDVPLRDQNLMLSTAGFAALYSERDLEAADMAPVRQALDFMLQQQQPYPALVVDRHWNLWLQNAAAAQLIGEFVDLAALPPDLWRDRGLNMMRLMFHPAGLRPWVANWSETASHLIQRLHREALGDAQADESRQLLSELLQAHDLPKRWSLPDWQAHPVPLLTLHLRKGKLDLHLFSTIATLGTAHDITLQELRIECLFPADDVSRAYFHQTGASA